MLTEQGYPGGRRCLLGGMCPEGRISSALLLDTAVHRAGEPLAIGHDVTASCIK